MSDNLLSPTDAKAAEEIAKATGKAVDLTRDVGSFLGRVVGTLPEDIVGLAGGDWLRHARMRNLASMSAKTDEILRQRQVKESASVSPSIAIPLLEAARDEGREELQAIWAKLLAAAMDPARASIVRLSLIQAVKQLDSLDAQIFEEIPSMVAHYSPSASDFLASKMRVSEDEVLVSFVNLETLNLINTGDAPAATPEITPLGKLLMRAIRG
jgi:hypothetical protein